MQGNPQTVTERKPGGEKEQRCTAPHPVLPFLYFLITFAVTALAGYLIWKLR